VRAHVEGQSQKDEIIETIGRRSTHKSARPVE
jgi:hypothetical protein